MTEWAALMVTVHVPAPEQSPLQPTKVEGEVAAAVNVTTALRLNAYEQVEPQLIPAGLLVTVPVPVPDLLTVRVWVLVDAGIKAVVPRGLPRPVGPS